MNALLQFSEFLKNARGPRATLIAVVSGALSAFAFAPFHVFPLLLLALAVLVCLLDAKSTRPLRRAAIIGWGFGFGQFLIGLHWVGYAFLVDPNAHAWQIPFVAVLLPGGLALFPMAAAILYVRFRPKEHSNIFLFAFLFAAAEFARGHLLTGFPWNIAGYAWGALPAVMQSAAFIGAYGLTLVTILFGASLAGLPERRNFLPAALSILFLAFWAAGEARLAYADARDVEGVRLRIVQPNVPQNEKYAIQYVLRNWNRLLSLSSIPSKEKLTHLIWPEAAPPFVLMREPVALAQLRDLIRNRYTLLSGAVRIAQAQYGQINFYNSFYVFAPDGRLAATYDKFHLVPFGEYMPFQETMDRLGITKVTGGPGSFSAGDGPRTISVPRAPQAGPLICYEVIFPREVTGVPRPQWLVNVTDDSWFGPAAGPMQHLLIARMRAIEEGLPIARAASTGVSAVIDAYGRIRKQLPLNIQGIVDAPLPIALPPTFFVRYGAFAIFSLFILIGIGVFVPTNARHT